MSMSTATLAQQLMKRLQGANLLRPEEEGQSTEEKRILGIPSVKSNSGSLQPKKVPTWEEIKAKSWETGLKNREHYLKLAAKSGDPWHHHVKQEDQYSELIVVDPIMAQALINSMAWNRRLSAVSTEAYGRDIKTGHWIQTHESLAVDVVGQFYDGQHRVIAVMQTGKEECFYVTFNVPVEAAFVTDSGRKRSTADKLRYISNNKADTKLAAVARSMMRGNSNSKVKFTDSEIAEFAIKYQEIITWAIKVLPKKRADLQACAAKFALYYGKEKLEPFCHRYTNMLFNGPTDPAKVLFSWLDKQNRVEQLTVYRKTQTALEHEIANRPVKNLHERETDFFKFDNKWDIEK